MVCYNVGEITSLFHGNTRNTINLAFLINNLCLSCEKEVFMTREKLENPNMKN